MKMIPFIMSIRPFFKQHRANALENDLHVNQDVQTSHEFLFYYCPNKNVLILGIYDKIYAIKSGQNILIITNSVPLNNVLFIKLPSTTYDTAGSRTYINIVY